MSLHANSFWCPLKNNALGEESMTTKPDNRLQLHQCSVEWCSEEWATAREDSVQMSAHTDIRDQQWGARPPKPGKNEQQILTASWVRGIRAVVETFKENTLGNMLRPCSKDLWLWFDSLNSWEQIKRDRRVIWVPYKATKYRTFPKLPSFKDHLI